MIQNNIPSWLRSASKVGEIVILVLAWGWSALGSVGGIALIINRGPLPITNGWFALFSGLAACPLLGWLLKKRINFAVSIYAQMAVALLVMVAGRVAVVVILHRPFIPHCSQDCW